MISIIGQDGYKTEKYIIKELTSAVVSGGTYSINMICKYAPASTTATDFIAMHNAVVGVSANNYQEKLIYDYNFDGKTTYNSFALTVSGASFKSEKFGLFLLNK